MTLDLPRVIGHRGAAAHAPENTLISIRKARELGCRMIEFDATLTRDGVPVLLHDDTLDRTTSGTGEIADADFTIVRTLDAGAWFGREFAGEKVPTLEEALDLAHAIGLDVNIEIKPSAAREVETAERVLAAARQTVGVGGPAPFISSFSVAALEIAHRTAPDWPRGYLIWDRPRDWQIIADRLDATTLNVSHERESPETIAAYLETGRPVLCYTVNDGARARTLFSLGVSAVFSDRPEVIPAG